MLYFSAIDHLRRSIIPDAATLISQGYSLVLETDGKYPELSQRVVRMQTELRDRFQDLQNSRSPAKLDDSYLQNSPVDNQNILSQREKHIIDKKITITLKSKYQKSQMTDADVEELTAKILKNVANLIGKNVNRLSEVDLTNHIMEIKVCI